VDSVCHFAQVERRVGLAVGHPEPAPDVDEFDRLDRTGDFADTGHRPAVPIQVVVQDAGPDVGVDPDEPKVTPGALDRRRDLPGRYPELCVRTGCDLLVVACTDPGVDPKRDPTAVAAVCESVEGIHRAGRDGRRRGVTEKAHQTVEVLCRRVDGRVVDPRRCDAGVERGPQLAGRGTLDAGTLAAERPQSRETRVCLRGVVDVGVGERLGQTAVVLAHPLAVEDVQRGAVFAGQGSQAFGVPVSKASDRRPAPARIRTEVESIRACQPVGRVALLELDLVDAAGPDAERVAVGRGRVPVHERSTSSRSTASRVSASTSSATTAGL